MKLQSLTLIAALACSTAYAQNVEIKDAWIRTSVPGQKATGAFMKITAKDGTKLVGASSPAAGVTEVHEMKMEGDVMKMRAIPGGLDIAAGKTVELKPGGYHVMLMDLKGQVKDGDTVPVTLVVEGKDGKRQSVELKVPARTAAAPAMKHGEGHKHKH